MAQLAVDGHEEARPDERQHQLEFFLAGVAGDMHRHQRRVDDLGPARNQPVDDARDLFLVAGNRRRRHDHGVAGLNFDLPVRALGHAGQRRLRLTLAAGRDDRDAFIGQAQRLPQVDHQIRRDLQMAQLARDLGGLDHRITCHGHDPAIPLRCIEHLLDPAEQGGEGRHDDAALGVAENLVEGGFDDRLGQGIAGPFGARGIAEQREHALRTQLTQPRKSRLAPAHRRIVELEVPGVHDGADGRMQRQPDAVGDRVGDGEELDAERTHGERLARQDATQVEGLAAWILGQLGLDQPAGKPRRINRRVRRQHVVEQVGQRADMVFMSVGDDDRSHPGRVLAQIRKVRDDQVDAQHIVFRKHDAGIRDD